MGWVEAVARAAQPIEERPRAQALGDGESELEIAVAEIAEQPSGEPVVVQRPGGKQLGAAVAIVLEAAKRLDGVDGGKRVAYRLRPCLGVPTELHVAARAVGLRHQAVRASGGGERPDLRRAGLGG